MIGRTLSHYRIVEPLGAGGMGEVYRARDEKLGRDVAVKVLPADSLSDETARRRFQKEAEALVRLSHPHIATLFDVDSDDGTDFIVMEVVPGPTLKERLQDGPLREKEVVRLGTQLVRGLMAAHEKGIIHRDLKPSNLSLTEDGLLKILDFGLVRLLQTDPGSSGETAPTETAAGRAAGTLPYMSPEQLRGRGVDSRSDLYAVGAVLFELATGRRVFEQANEVDLADAILHEAPSSPRSHKPTLSPGLEAIILKALDKDPELRYQTAREMLVDLERLQVSSTAGSGSADVAIPAARRRRRRLPLLAGLAATIVVAIAVWGPWPPAPPRVVGARAVTRGVPTTLMIPPAGTVSWATDGSRLFYVAPLGSQSPALFQVPLAGGEPQQIPLPLKGRLALFGYSEPDSALLVRGSVEARSPEPEGFPLWLVPVPGGSPRRIGDLRAWSADLSPEGDRLALISDGHIHLARRDGSESRPLLEVGDGSTDLRWAPDGRRLRYSSWGPEGRNHERWIWETSMAGEPPRPICAGSGGVWVGGTHYVFSRGPALKLGNLLTDRFASDLYAIRDGGRTPWFRTQPVRLTFGPLRYTQPGTSPDGERLFAWGESFRGELLRYDLEERAFRPYLSGLSASDVDVSPDGEWLAWASYPEQALWRGRPDGSERLQLTTPPLLAFWTQWSPDGREIAFIGARPGEFGLTLHVISPDGGGLRTMPSDSAERALPWNPCWVDGGRAIAFSPMAIREQSPGQLYLWHLETDEVRTWSGTEGMLWPVCSVEGTVLAQRFPPDYSAPRSSVYSPETKSWTHDAPPAGAYPTWTSDGRSTAFLDIASMQIRRLWPQTGRIETIVDAGDMQLGGLTIVPWLGLAPNDSPLVMRSHDTREIYALDFEAP